MAQSRLREQMALKATTDLGVRTKYLFTLLQWKFLAGKRFF